MNKINWKLLLGALCCCGLFLAIRVLPTFSSSTLPFLADSGIGYDPLTINEADRALAFASQGNEQPLLESNPLRTLLQPMELLAVERYDAPKESKTAGVLSRQGDVYFYDYATDTLIHSIVDINSGEVRMEKLHGVQLPLTAHEKARTIQIIHDDAELWSALAERYQLITAEPLTTPDQLQSKVSLFLAESMPDQVNTAAQLCGQHRCAQAILFTVDRTLLEALPVVDLSQGRVIQVLSDSWSVPAEVEAIGGSAS